MGTPAERFKEHLYSSKGKNLRDKLAITLGRNANLSVICLSRKRPCLTFEFKLIDCSTYRLKSWVVKFDPKGSDDGWNNVKQEYSILKDLPSLVPAPTPIYCSSVADERAVGTAFIVMQFVPGLRFSSVSKITPSKRRQVCTSIMKTMAVVHSYTWSGMNGRTSKFAEKSDFWSSQVNTWQNNYVSIRGDKNTRDFFSLMNRSMKPRGTDTRLIHGEMDISNFIFDDEYNVKAILNWKYHTNGDPMVDVGYFLMMFLQPAVYGYPMLRDIKLLIGPPDRNTPSEDEMLQVYRTEARRLNVTFCKKAFNYAKAVNCLRLITIVRAALGDWEDHEVGQYVNIRDHPKKVVEMLTAAGQYFYRQS